MQGMTQAEKEATLKDAWNWDRMEVETGSKKDESIGRDGSTGSHSLGSHSMKDPSSDDDSNMKTSFSDDESSTASQRSTAIKKGPATPPETEGSDTSDDESDSKQQSHPKNIMKDPSDDEESEDQFDEQSDSTRKNTNQKQNNGMSPPRKTKMRLSCRIQLEAHKVPLYSLIDGLTAQLDWLKSNDPSLVVYPWSDNVQRIVKHRIHSSADLPRTSSEIISFFDKKTKPRGQKGGLLDIHMYIGTNLADWKHFKSIQLGPAPENHKLWYKDMQTDSTTEAGWLLYSLPHFDAKTFKAQLKDTYDLDIVLRYRMISNGSWGNG